MNNTLTKEEMQILKDFFEYKGYSIVECEHFSRIIYCLLKLTTEKQIKKQRNRKDNYSQVVIRLKDLAKYYNKYEKDYVLQLTSISIKPYIQKMRKLKLIKYMFNRYPSREFRYSASHYFWLNYNIIEKIIQFEEKDFSLEKLNFNFIEFDGRAETTRQLREKISKETQETFKR